jgi:hypothetical protein
MPPMCTIKVEENFTLILPILGHSGKILWRGSLESGLRRWKGWELEIGLESR